MQSSTEDTLFSGVFRKFGVYMYYYKPYNKETLDLDKISP